MVWIRIEIILKTSTTIFQKSTTYKNKKSQKKVKMTLKNNKIKREAIQVSKEEQAPC